MCFPNGSTQVEGCPPPFSPPPPGSQRPTLAPAIKPQTRRDVQRNGAGFKSVKCGGVATGRYDSVQQAVVREKCGYDSGPHARVYPLVGRQLGRCRCMADAQHARNAPSGTRTRLMNRLDATTGLVDAPVSAGACVSQDCPSPQTGREGTHAAGRSSEQYKCAQTRSGAYAALPPPPHEGKGQSHISRPSRLRPVRSFYRTAYMCGIPLSSIRSDSTAIRALTARVAEPRQMAPDFKPGSTPFRSATRPWEACGAPATRAGQSRRCA